MLEQEWQRLERHFVKIRSTLLQERRDNRLEKGKAMSEFIEVRTTIDTIEGAQKIADALVESRVAACVQISGPITSTYWWKGQVERAQEWMCVVKTRKDLYSAAETVIGQVHSYEEPEIIATAISRGKSRLLEVD